MEKKSDFVQIPNRLLISGISPGAYMTYAAIVEVAWEPGGEHFKGIAALAQARGVSVRTISGHLRELEEVGAITVVYPGKRRKARITLCEWRAIGTRDRSFSADHTSIGRAAGGLGVWHESAVHTSHDRRGTSDVIGSNRPIHIEEDIIKKMPSEQQDPSAAASSSGVGLFRAREWLRFVPPAGVQLHPAVELDQSGLERFESVLESMADLSVDQQATAIQDALRGDHETFPAFLEALQRQMPI